MSWKIPKLDPRHWWVRSASSYPPVGRLADVPAVVWNPFAAIAPEDRNPFSRSGAVAFDLLDDWTIHYQFGSVRDQVNEAYKAAFDRSSHVFANSEATLDLAHRFGRSDAVLLTNGVDPERFSTESQASGPFTVGYVGKIGQRLNAELISRVCESFPDIRFVFAGYFVDVNDTYRGLLSRFPNVELLGDVHYEDVPSLMATFDLGWVPHAVGDGEVGGDVIKTYEYRATGLQVLTTPILGAGRRLTEGVHVVPAEEQVEWLRQAANGRERLDRIPAEIPPELTWRVKTQTIADAIGLRLVL